MIQVRVAGAILVVAAAMKGLFPCSCAEMLHDLGASMWAGSVACVAGIAAEAALGMLLLLRPAARLPRSVALVIYLLFAAVMAAGVAKRGWAFRCACFGAILSLHAIWMIALDLGIVAALLWTGLRERWVSR